MRFIWFLLLPIALFGKPKGHKVVAGTAKVQEMGSAQEIQTSDRAIINWDEFSIGAGETTRFLQPSTNSAVLNRVANGTSTIDGLLQANGRVYLLNPNGVLIGPTGSIQTESFIASTLDFDNEDFFKNNELLFHGDSQARIVNLGKITALGGDVFILAKAVVNVGTLQAQEGVVGIAAGEEILLKPSGMQRIFIAPKQEAEKGEGGIENPGLIEAASAELRADGNAFRFAINQSGTIQANGIKKENGRVFLVAEGGTSINAGSISAPGGKVHILGEQVGINEKGKVDASSDTGGGEVLIGGDFQGKNPDILNAKMSVVMEGGEVFANAHQEGDGGKIIVWSDETAFMEGTLYARGGERGGDGGFMEVSGAKNLHFTGMAYGEAPQGRVGQLLLDPSGIIIENTPNSQMSFDATLGIYTATAEIGTLDSGNLGAESLGTVLNTNGVDIIVSTAGNHGNPGNIEVKESVSWNSNRSLTFLADNNIQLTNMAALTASGTGGITFQAQNDIVVTNATEVKTTSGAISFAAGNDILLEPIVDTFKIETASGNLSMQAGRDFTLGKVDNSSQQVVLETSGGLIDINVGRDFSFFGSNAPSNIMLVDVGNHGNETASFAIGRNLIMKGGTGIGNSVSIGHLGDGSGFMSFTVGGNVEITGGSGDFTCYAQIGFNSGSASNKSGSGDIVFTEIGGNVLITGGTGEGSFAQIGHAGGFFPGSSNYTGSGDIILNNIRRDVRLQANQTSAIIGLGNPLTEGGDTFIGDVIVDAIGTVTLTASDNAPAAIGFSVGGDGTSGAQSALVAVSGEGLNLIAANEQDAYVGLYNSIGTTISSSDIGTVFVGVRNDVNLNGGQTAGPGVSGAAVIGTGGSSSNTFANVQILADDVFLRCANDGPALIQSASIDSPGRRTVEIEAENIIALGAASSPCAKILSSGDILAIADFDIHLQKGSSVTSQDGDITLVVDNDAPESPEVGDGRFIIDQGAFIETNGPVRIFTAKQNQNSINSQINNETFVPGEIFVGTATEIWGTYFPDDSGGFPFAIFYKKGLPQSLSNELWRALAEMFQNLRTYDDLLFDYKCFQFGYDNACYDPFFYPKGMVSSFDLFGDETREILRRKYRNYHTKFVESF